MGGYPRLTLELQVSLAFSVYELEGKYMKPELYAHANRALNAFRIISFSFVFFCSS
jgi:hypothetical protein